MARIIELATRYGRYGQEKNNSTTQTGRLESEPQESRENMAKGRAQDAQETIKARVPLAE